MLTLRQQFAGTGADPETLTVAGQTLVAFHDWTFLLGPGFCAGIGNGLLLGYIMYTSGLLPRRLAAFGMVAGSFAIVAATGALFGVYERQSAPQMLLTFPEMIWELTFGVYLIAKGFTVARAAPGRRAAGPRALPPQPSSRRIAGDVAGHGGDRRCAGPVGGPPARRSARRAQRRAGLRAAFYGWLVQKVAKSPCWIMIGRLPASSRKL